MKNVYIYLLVLMSFGLANCMTLRQPLLSTPAVSMTHDSVPVGKPAKAMGKVTSRFCPGDKSVLDRGDQTGLMDEVIAKAQREKDASYISGANFYLQGTCMVLEGEAMRLE